MFIIKHPNDLRQLPSGSPERDLLGRFLDRLIKIHERPSGYDPEDHGYVVMIEGKDVDRQRILPELPCPLAEVPWEGVTMEGGFFHAVVLTNNDFGIDFLIPNEPWLSEPLRASLEENLSQD